MWRMEISLKRQETENKNQEEIKGLKSTITEMKISTEECKSKLSRQKKESVNLKLGKQKLLSFSNRKENDHK